ncbi:MAG: VWA domain-containing protein, partial [Pseudomonadota bacterium]
APRRLPQRLSFRRRPHRRGDQSAPRRSLRQAARTGGDLFDLPRTERKRRQRRIVCLIDVSGSMKDRSDRLLEFAHALMQVGTHVEVFTLGTRLTRITRGLAPRDRPAALMRVARQVADLDGGTRIGEALRAFLSVPRYAGFARGALVLVLSDGLERGDPAAMIDATARLSRRAWRLHWLTPLAADPDYRPVTAAMRGILPWLDDLADGARIPAICSHVLNLARTA